MNLACGYRSSVCSAQSSALFLCLSPHILHTSLVHVTPPSPPPSSLPLTWNTLAMCPDSSLASLCPFTQSHSTTCRSSLPDASSRPLGEKLMQFTHPSCSASLCSSRRRLTNDCSPYHWYWNEDCVRMGS